MKNLAYYKIDNSIYEYNSKNSLKSGYIQYNKTDIVFANTVEEALKKIKQKFNLDNNDYEFEFQEIENGEYHYSGQKKINKRELESVHIYIQIYQPIAGVQQ